MSKAQGAVLVTGGSGQVATALLDAGEGLPLLRLGRPEFDFDRPDSPAGAARRRSVAGGERRRLYSGRPRRERRTDGIARQSRRAGGAGRLLRRGRHSADPYLDRLRVRWNEGRRLRRDRSNQSDRRLWRLQARRRAGGAGGLQASYHPAHLLGLCRARAQLRADHAEPARAHRAAAGGGRSDRLPDRRPRPGGRFCRSSPASVRRDGTTATPGCSTPPARAGPVGTGWRARCSRRRRATAWHRRRSSRLPLRTGRPR